MKDKESIPKKLTLEWIKTHSHIRLAGDDLRWSILAWSNIIFLKISKNWTPDEMDGYVDQLSELPEILTKQWDRIFFVFDLSRMKFRKRDAFHYLRFNWLKFLDREEIKVCIVEESKMRRLMWQSLYKIIGKLDKIKLFTDYDDAFDWVREQIINQKSLQAK